MRYLQSSQSWGPPCRWEVCVQDDLIRRQLHYVTQMCLPSLPSPRKHLSQRNVQELRKSPPTAKAERPRGTFFVCLAQRINDQVILVRALVGLIASSPLVWFLE